MNPNSHSSMFGTSFSHTSSQPIDISTMTYSSPWVGNSVNESVYGYDGMEAPHCRSFEDYHRINGQMESCTPTPNPEWCNQFDLDRGYEDTLSHHYLDSPQSYHEPFDHYHASQPLSHYQGPFDHYHESPQLYSYHEQEHDIYPSPPYHTPFEHFEDQAPFYQTQPSSFSYQTQTYDASHAPHDSTLEFTLEDTQEDDLQLFMQMQNCVNSRVDKALEHKGQLLDDIKGQLALLMQTLGVQEREEISTHSQPNSHEQVLESEFNLTLHHEQDHPTSTLRHETTIDQTILSQELESRDNNLRVSEEIIENVNRVEEECDEITSESEEEFMIEDSKKEESEHGEEEDNERKEEPMKVASESNLISHSIEPIHPIFTLKSEDIIEHINFPQEYESREETLKVSKESIGDKSRDDELENKNPKIAVSKQLEREEFEIEDSKQEEKCENFGLLHVGHVHDKEDVDGLEANPIMSRGHEIPIFEPLSPSPKLPEPSKLQAPTLESNIVHMADQQKEGEDQLFHSVSFIGISVHDHFSSSTFYDPFYPWVFSRHLVEFIKAIVIVYSYAWLNFLKVSKMVVWNVGQFPPCGIG